MGLSWGGSPAFVFVPACKKCPWNLDMMDGMWYFETQKREGGMAFLPPSETSAEVIPGTANGKIIVDMTVGKLYHFGERMGDFGLVQNPVTILVEDGFIVEINGDGMADELKRKLFRLPAECRKMAELGQGLSKMEPTGLIGVDESIADRAI